MAKCLYLEVNLLVIMQIEKEVYLGYNNKVMLKYMIVILKIIMHRIKEEHLQLKNKAY
jgi:hypothetical protein